MARVSVEPDPAAVAAIAPEKPEPAIAPPTEVSRFYDFFIPSPSLVIFANNAQSYHSVVEVIYIGAFRCLCKVPEERRLSLYLLSRPLRPLQ